MKSFVKFLEANIVGWILNRKRILLKGIMNLIQYASKAGNRCDKVGNHSSCERNLKVWKEVSNFHLAELFSRTFHTGFSIAS